jgi:hypothetical protein
VITVNHLLEASHPLSFFALRLCGSVADPSSILRTHFQVPYAATPLFVTLLSRAEPRDTKTAGVWGYSSHFGARCAQSKGQLFKREEMGTGARGAPVPEVGHYVKIKRAQSRKPESHPNEGRVNSP